MSRFGRSPVPVARTSRQARPQPTPTEPVPDSEIEESRNIPGRGVVDHGVPVPPNDPWNTGNVPYDPTKDLVTFAPVDVEPEPIPVYTVAGPGDTSVVHAFRTSYAAVGPLPVMLAGQHVNRTKLKLANRGSRTLFIGDEPTVNLMNGFPVPAGSSFDITSSRAVYGLLDRYVANAAPGTAANPAPGDETQWIGSSAANSTLSRVTAPWNSSRGAIRVLCSTAGTAGAYTPVLGSFMAGQTVYYRFKVDASNAGTPVTFRAWDLSGTAIPVGPTVSTTPNTANVWQEISGSFQVLTDAPALRYRIYGTYALNDTLIIGDVSIGTENTDTFQDAGVVVDNQPVNIYEEFDIAA